MVARMRMQDDNEMNIYPSKAHVNILHEKYYGVIHPQYQCQIVSVSRNTFEPDLLPVWASAARSSPKKSSANCVK
jgi:hypothetical protein